MWPWNRTEKKLVQTSEDYSDIEKQLQPLPEVIAEAMRQVRWIGGMMVHPECGKVFGADAFKHMYLALDGHRMIAGLDWDDVIDFAEAGKEDFDVVQNASGVNMFVFKESTAISY